MYNILSVWYLSVALVELAETSQLRGEIGGNWNML